MGNEDSSIKVHLEWIFICSKITWQILKTLYLKLNKIIIQNFWTFNYDSNLDVHSQIKIYFDKLKEIKNGKDKTICLKECLLVRIKNIFFSWIYFYYWKC